jgi:hypothetical protein
VGAGEGASVSVGAGVSTTLTTSGAAAGLHPARDSEMMHSASKIESGVVFIACLFDSNESFDGASILGLNEHFRNRKDAFVFIHHRGAGTGRRVRW